MRFYDLAETWSKIEATSGRLEIAEILASLFRTCKPAQAKIITYLTEGILLPPYDGLELGIGEKYIIESIVHVSGNTKSVVEKQFKKLGDLGTVAEWALANKKQTSLASSELTLEGAYDSFTRLAKLSGKGSQEGKIRMLAEMLNSSSPIEARYIARFCAGKLRLGIAGPTIIDALSMAITEDKSKAKRETIDRAYNLCSDLGTVAELTLSDFSQVENFKIQSFRPLRPALAERLSTPEEIIAKIADGRQCAAEGKYDGFRIQVHKDGNKVELYSRKLERITHMFPEITEAAKKLPAKRAILEGEALAYNEKEHKYYSFQITIQRKRKYGIEQMQKEFPLRLFAFDLIYLDSKDYTTEKYSLRRERLEALVKGNETIEPSKTILVGTADALGSFFNSCLAEGLEGIIAKDLDAPYVAGARKFAWIKLKKSYGATADTFDTVIVGYYLGEGQRTEFGFGGLLVAVRNEQTGLLQTIARIGSGFSEEEMGTLREMLSAIKVKGKPAEVESKITPDFWVEPKYVATVSADEITLSPMHTCGMADGKGYALRFPRLISLRQDKSPEEATTTSEVESMYSAQKKPAR